MSTEAKSGEKVLSDSYKASWTKRARILAVGGLGIAIAYFILGYTSIGWGEVEDDFHPAGMPFVGSVTMVIISIIVWTAARTLPLPAAKTDVPIGAGQRPGPAPLS